MFKQFNNHIMKRLTILILLVIISNSVLFSQSAKPNKLGLFGDFVGVVTFSGMNHGFVYNIF